MTASSQRGVTLACGSRIFHDTEVDVKSAFPPDLNIPGTLHVFSPGHAGDPLTPTFKGPQGIFPFDTNMRMPRHVHMTAGDPAAGKPKEYVVEKVQAVSGVGLTELAGEIYVIPPYSMVLIGPGVPHTWTACPPGLDLQALGISDEKIVSDGKFLAVYEYSDATTFYPTRKADALKSIEEYERCDDLHDIRFPKMEVKDVLEKANFVWGKKVAKLVDGKF